MKIIMDVWEGKHSENHVARYVRDVEDAFELSRVELRAGFLVNLRAEAVWGTYEDFDIRSERVQ